MDRVIRGEIILPHQTLDPWFLKPEVGPVVPTKGRLMIDTTGHSLEVKPLARGRWEKYWEHQERSYKAGDTTWQGWITITDIERAIDDKLESQPEDEETERMLNEHLPPEYADLRGVFSKRESDTLPPNRPGIDFKIELTAPLPISRVAPLYRLSVEQLEILRTTIQEYMRKGFIEPSTAEYTSPVLFARKADGSWRFCVDYRRVNEVTRKTLCPPPLIDETLDRVSKAKIFTKLDIRQAFHRIRMAEESKALSAFKTRLGTFQWKVVPFGFTNGPAAFQAYINSVLAGILDQFCTAYMDDILIYSENLQEHRKHVREVLARLHKAGLQADIKKSEFHVTQVTYLGLVVGTDGIRVDPRKIEALEGWKPPTSVKGVRSFLGFCNFFRRFIRDHGRIAKPLHDLTKKGQAFQMGKQELEAFERLKRALTTAPVLCYYSPSRPTKVETDASDGVVGAVLSQLQDDGHYHPVAYFSKTMQDAETRYPIQDKEMLAVVLALQEWRVELVGRQEPFLVVTDHRALEHFSTKRLLSARQAGWAEILAELSFKITYRPGKENVCADALSRKAEDLATVREKLERDRMMALIREEQLVGTLLRPEQMVAAIAAMDRCTLFISSLDEEGQAGLQGWYLKEAILEANRREAESKPEDEVDADGRWVWNGRLQVPEKGPRGEYLRTELIREAHETKTSAHPGKNKLKQILQGLYYWPGMGKDIETFLGNCRACKRNMTFRDKKPGLLHPLPIPETPWEHISVDGKDMPKNRNGCDYIWVFVDRLSKMTFVIPGHKTDAARDIARHYYERIFPVMGMPSSILSDRGPQFISAFFGELCKIAGVEQKLSSAGHPQTDGNTEIVNQWLDHRLRHYINHFQDDWDEHLPAVVHAQNSLPHESTGLTPFQVVFGVSPRYSFDWRKRTDLTDGVSDGDRTNRQMAQDFARRAKKAWDLAREGLEKAQEQQAAQANKKRREPDFDVGDEVYISKKGWSTDRPSTKLDHQNAGPFPITEKIGEGRAFRVRLPESMKVHDVFHPDRLRKARDDPLPGQVLEPPPPEEINGEDEWELEYIRSSKLDRGVLKYQVQWKGWDPDEEYYPAENFRNAPGALKKYHDEHPDRPGPPVNLDHWLQAAEEDTDAAVRDDDNKPARKGQRKTRRHRRL
jgi:hypothetical protein